MTFGETLPDIITTAAHDAALGIGDWTVPLERLAEAYGATSAAILIERVENPWGLSVRIAPEMHRLYFERYAAENPLRAILRQTPYPPGSVVTGSQLLSSAEFKLIKPYTQTEFYENWVKPSNIGSSMTLIVDPERLAFVSVTRPVGSADFAPVDVALLRQISPALRVAVAAHIALRGAASERAMLVETLDRVSGVPGVLIVALDGQVLHANQTAARLLQARDGLRSEARSGGLSAQSVTETAKLRYLIGSAINASTGGGPMRVSRPWPRTPLAVSILPLRSRAAEASGFPSCGKSAALVLVVDPEMAAPPPPTELLQSLYGLTAAEAAVAVRVAGGSEALPAVATSMGVAPATIRTHLNRAFGKTRTRRQAEFSALLSRLSSLTSV
jgi:DNA-binding CsgD family transcriptional regulator